MLNQFKSAEQRVQEGKEVPGDEDKVAILKRYTSFGKFSEQKDQLLSMWAKDKTCGWWKTYEESRGQTYKETSDGVSGFGSRPNHVSFSFVHESHSQR